MNSSIILKSTDANNKEQSKTITFINPDAASDKLVTFAQGLNRLTNNTYKETNRVDKLNCDTDSGTGKPEPTLTITDGSYTYNGDGDIFGYITDNFKLSINRTNKTFQATSTTGASTYTITLHATETANFAAKTVSYTNNAD